MKKNLRELVDPSFFAGVAHRGLHDEEATENGLRAFAKAIDAGLAFELDIHLTRDGELVVCHDYNLLRTTGKPGIIEELTLKEIKDHYRLLDGEEVPTYQEVLSLNQERSLIVTEIKTYRHNWWKIAEKLKKVLKQIKDRKKIVIISFDSWALLRFRRGKFLRGQLLTTKKKNYLGMACGVFESVDVETTMTGEKRLIDYRKKGCLVNTWTVEDKKTLEQVLPLVDTVTFQHLPASLIKEKMKK